MNGKELNKLENLQYHLSNLQNTVRKQNSKLLKLALENENLKKQLKLNGVGRSTKTSITEFQEYMTKLLGKKDDINNFLIRTGIIDGEGNLTENYRD